MIEKILSEFSTLGISELFVSSIMVFIPTMGFVYFLGKMIGVARTPRLKNIFASIAIVALSIYRDYLVNGKYIKSEMLERVFGILVLIGLVIILYILIGQRLFSHFDSFMSKKVGEGKILDEDKDNDRFFQKKSNQKKNVKK